MTEPLFCAAAATDAELDRILARVSARRGLSLARVAGAGFVAAVSPATGAMCALDAARAKLSVTRDSAGTHPVHFSTRGGFVVGSSAREVLLATGDRAVADPLALARFLADGSIAGAGETMFAGVRQLAGSEGLEWTPKDGARTVPRASPLEAPAGPELPLADRARELRELLFAAVERQARGLGTGVALSGGIDSSGIGAALRACLEGRMAPSFCFVHGDRELPAAFDERPWAELAAKHLGSMLHRVCLEARAIPGLLERVARSQEFPFGSPVVMAQAEVFRVAADHGVELMLSGHGPDYLFGGGDSHVRARAGKLLFSGRLVAAAHYLKGAAPYAGTTPLRLLDGSVRQAIGARRSPPLVVEGMREAWFRDRGVGPRDDARVSPRGMRPMIREQVHHARLPSALAWERCNAAAAGLEVGYPYLGDPMLRLSAALPDNQLVSDHGETRPVQRAALRGLVPDAILDRPHPVGFAVPAVRWLREADWLDDRLPRIAAIPFCDATRLVTLRSRLASGDWAAAFTLWRWVTLSAWAEAHGVAFD